jgi:hypothetical protein
MSERRRMGHAAAAREVHVHVQDWGSRKALQQGIRVDNFFNKLVVRVSSSRVKA